MADGFVFQPTYYQSIANLPDEERLALYDAICRFGLYGDEPDNLSPIATGYFILMQPTIAASKKRYDAARNNGKKGGAPKGNQNARKQAKTTDKQAKNNLYIDTDIDIAIDDKKDNLEEENNPQTPRKKYGEYKNVLLTDEEMEKLKAEYPSDYLERIERLSEYQASKGKAYKNHLATIRAWARKERKEEDAATSRPNYADEWGEDLPSCFRTVQYDE